MSCDAGQDFQSKVIELDRQICQASCEYNAREATAEERAEYYKRRNALYSQRKYYKRKIRQEGLFSEKQRLEEKNNTLRDENKALESALAWAKAQVAQYEQSIRCTNNSTNNEQSSLILSLLQKLQRASVETPQQIQNIAFNPPIQLPGNNPLDVSSTAQLLCAVQGALHQQHNVNSFSHDPMQNMRLSPSSDTSTLLSAILSGQIATSRPCGWIPEAPQVSAPLFSHPSQDRGNTDAATLRVLLQMLGNRWTWIESSLFFVSDAIGNY